MAQNSDNTSELHSSLPHNGRFREVFEKAPIGLAIVDSTLHITRVNESLCNALGYGVDELVGRKFVDITHPDDVRPDIAYAEKLFKGEISSYQLEKRFQTKRGDIAWLNLTALLIRDEKTSEPLYGLAMVEDITDRRRAQEALRTSEERYRSFVVNSSEGIWRLEIEQPIDVTLPPEEQLSLLYKYGYLAECNDALAKMYGHQRADDMIGLRFGDFKFASNPASLTLLRKLVSNNYRVTELKTEKLIDHATTKYFITNLIGIIINNHLLRVWGVQTDRSQQHEYEVKLEQSHQQLRSLSAYLQSVREKERTDLAREIHDTLGQALTGIKIELSLLLKKLGSEPELADKALPDKLAETIRSVGESINSVKTLSTELRPGVLDKFGLIAAIEWQCEEFSRRFNIKCNFKSPQTAPQFSNSVSTGLFRIFQEALTNVARHAQADIVSVELTTDSENVTLAVSDNGRGITVDELNAPGSLGLLGMSERAGFLNGMFSVKGKPGIGTVVTASVPLHETTSGATDD